MKKKTRNILIYHESLPSPGFTYSYYHYHSSRLSSLFLRIVLYKEKCHSYLYCSVPAVGVANFLSVTEHDFALLVDTSSIRLSVNTQCRCSIRVCFCIYSVALFKSHAVCFTLFHFSFTNELKLNKF